MSRFPATRRSPRPTRYPPPPVADPRRRPRQGPLPDARGQSVMRPGRDEQLGGVVLADERRGRASAGHARQRPGHQPDRPEGRQVRRLLIEEGVDIAKRALPGDPARSRRSRRRCSSPAPRAAPRSRRSPPRTPRRSSRIPSIPAVSASRPGSRARSPSGSASSKQQLRRLRASWSGALRLFRRLRRLAGRDQPADRHQRRRATSWPSTPR